MAEKSLSVRVKQKNGSLEEFTNSNIILLKGEIAFVQMDEKNYGLYLGDGVTPFTELEPLFDTRFVLGKNEVDLRLVHIEPQEWDATTHVCTKEVSGIFADETKQFLMLAPSKASTEYFNSAGVSWNIVDNGKIEFQALVVPTVAIDIYVAIFGVRDENAGENKPVIRTDIDAVLSSTSTNPVENRVLTNKFDSIDVTLRSIMGEGTEGTESLSAISEKLNGVTTYSSTATSIGTLKGESTDKELKRAVIPFTLTVNRANLNPDIDISCLATSVSVNVAMMTEAHWTGKASTGEFFGSFPVMIDTTGKVSILNVPVRDIEYTVNGNITIEYTET